MFTRVFTGTLWAVFVAAVMTGYVMSLMQLTHV